MLPAFFLKPQGAGVAGHVFSLANGTQATGMLLLQVGEFHDVSRLRRKAMKKNNNFEKPMIFSRENRND